MAGGSRIVERLRVAGLLHGAATTRPSCEASDGVAAGAELVFRVILGTGGGIAPRGVPLHGADAIAGEWGHSSALAAPQWDGAPGLLVRQTGLHRETWLSGEGWLRITGAPGAKRCVAPDGAARRGGNCAATATWRATGTGRRAGWPTR